MKTLNKLALAASILAASGAALAQDKVVLGDNNEQIASVAKSDVPLDVPTMKIKLRGGQTNTLYFKPGGNLQILVDTTDTVVAATYTMQGNKVCVVLPVRGNDCWPYDANAAQGSVTKLTSDRGQEVTATYVRPGALADVSAMGTPVAAASLGQ